VIARLISFVVALSAAAAAAAVVVVSAAYAFYALVRTYLGPAGASACLTLAAAVVLIMLAVFLFGKAKGSKPKAKDKGGEAGGLIDKLGSLVGDRPIVAAGAAVAAGLLAWRNPTLVSALLRIAETGPKDDRRRR
jgi:hypothetical protein